MMFIQQMLVTVALATDWTHVLLGHVVFHVNEELLGGQLGRCTVTTLVKIPSLVLTLVLLLDGLILMFYPWSVAQWTHS